MALECLRSFPSYCQSRRFYENILNNPECEHICSWAPDGHCMIVYDKTALINELKNRQVCKQNDYSSFARQMRVGSFRNRDPTFGLKNRNTTDLSLAQGAC